MLKTPQYSLNYSAPDNLPISTIKAPGIVKFGLLPLLPSLHFTPIISYNNPDIFGMR